MSPWEYKGSLSSLVLFTQAYSSILLPIWLLFTELSVSFINSMEEARSREDLRQSRQVIKGHDNIVVFHT